MSYVDWIILTGFLVLTLVIGVWASRKAGKDATAYFLSDRQMPWWLLGISIVATTFSADTPNLVTDIVRQHGVGGNWMWWAFLLTGMLTVFVYARLWRRSGVMTDLSFYEIRYGGRPAAFLRGFRALYLGLFFNVIIMATVMLAGIKIAGVILGWSPLQTVCITGGVTLFYSVLGGLRGVIWTDFFMFIMAMVGAVAAAYYALDHPMVGGLEGLTAHFKGTGTLSFFPDLKDPAQYVPLLLIPIAVQWWSVWYPGAEPGGGGYAAQRMLAAKNEHHAWGAVLLFNIAHYALRPWPWIIVALASMMVFPDLASLQQAFPDVSADVVRNDMAYPAMIAHLPSGWMGVVFTSLIAALMSTLSTHLNWGSSYLVHDFYSRYIAPQATAARQVAIGRLFTIILMILAGFISLVMESALDGFRILLQVGAGTGLIYILRWFWWRVNSWTEISGMAISFGVACYFAFVHHGVLGLEKLPGHIELIWGVGITTIGWLIVTLLTRPEARAVLVSFYGKINPHPGGWGPVPGWVKAENALSTSGTPEKLSYQILAMVLACGMVYALLFSTGYALYGDRALSIIAAVAGGIFGWGVFILVRKGI